MALGTTLTMKSACFSPRDVVSSLWRTVIAGAMKLPGMRQAQNGELDDPDARGRL